MDTGTIEQLLLIVLIIVAVCFIWDMFASPESKEKWKPPEHGGL